MNLMKELSAEVTERLRDRGEREGEGEGEGGGRGGGGGERERRRTSPLLPPVSVATPTARPTDAASGEQDQKPIPPPKALKPKRKPGSLRCTCCMYTCFVLRGNILCRQGRPVMKAKFCVMHCVYVRMRRVSYSGEHRSG